MKFLFTFVMSTKDIPLRCWHSFELDRPLRLVSKKEKELQEYFMRWIQGQLGLRDIGTINKDEDSNLRILLMSGESKDVTNLYWNAQEMLRDVNPIIKYHYKI